jgi:hypothetical protein
VRAGDCNKIWGKVYLTDPSPKPCENRSDDVGPGDYVLVKGKNITMAKRCEVTFHPEDEMVLTADWDRFDEDMTGMDLVDLQDEEFLLWWQCIVPPKNKTPKQRTIQKKLNASAAAAKKKK